MEEEQRQLEERQEVEREQQELEEQIRTEYLIIAHIINVDYEYQNVFGNAQLHYHNHIWGKHYTLHVRNTFMDNLFEEHPELIGELQGLKNLEGMISGTHDDCIHNNFNHHVNTPTRQYFETLLIKQQQYFEFALKPEYCHLASQHVLK
jgi:hypothetical protein